jgi:cytochrome bd-type quinol oxidase subunit 1
VPTDWFEVIFSPVLWVPFPLPPMLFAYLTGAFCVPVTGAWYVLRREFEAEARIMLRMGLYLAAVLVPVQLVFGHLNGEYVAHRQPSMAAIEGGGATRSRPPKCCWLGLMSRTSETSSRSHCLEEAAAPQSSLALMFWGEGLFVFPLMLVCTAISWSVFRGKIATVGLPFGTRGRQPEVV